MKIYKIKNVNDPWIEDGFNFLNAYFGGEKGEMETFDVIQNRLLSDPMTVIDGYSFLYEMVVFTDDNDQIFAAGDYTVIVNHKEIKNGNSVVVHLSHIRVVEGKSGIKIINSFLKELTVDAARSFLLKLSLPLNSPITLAAEMECYEYGNEKKIHRLKRFLLADLKIVDPKKINYYQPDFAPAEEIDLKGGAEPLLLTLMIRRVNKEAESQITSDEVKHIIRCLYKMYDQGMRKQDMEKVYNFLKKIPDDDKVLLIDRKHFNGFYLI